MPCTKTGCHVYLEPYGEYAYGDAYEVGPICYLRLVQRDFEPLAPTLHYTIHDWDEWFDKDSPRGQCSTMVTREHSFTNHGYEGKEL